VWSAHTVNKRFAHPASLSYKRCVPPSLGRGVACGTLLTLCFAAAWHPTLASTGLELCSFASSSVLRDFPFWSLVKLNHILESHPGPLHGILFVVTTRLIKILNFLPEALLHLCSCWAKGCTMTRSPLPEEVLPKRPDAAGQPSYA